MKKIFKIVVTLILGVAMGFSLAGCYEKEPGKDSNIESPKFELKITTDREEFGIGERIPIDIILENQSGEDIELFYYFSSIVPVCSTGQFPTIEQSPKMRKSIFKNGVSEPIKYENLNGCFPIGRHELQYKSVFYLDGEKEEQSFEFWSNTIVISVYQQEFPNDLIATGDFMSLREAYDNLLLTRDDIKEICYYNSGKVYEVPEGAENPEDYNCWVQVDFTPKNKLKPKLEAQLRTDIKISYSAKFPRSDPKKIEVYYYGQYNDVYVVKLDSEEWSYGAISWVENFDGVVWWESAPEFKIFYYFEQ